MDRILARPQRSPKSPQVMTMRRTYKHIFEVTLFQVEHSRSNSYQLVLLQFQFRKMTRMQMTLYVFLAVKQAAHFLQATTGTTENATNANKRTTTLHISQNLDLPCPRAGVFLVKRKKHKITVIYENYVQICYYCGRHCEYSSKALKKFHLGVQVNSS